MHGGQRVVSPTLSVVIAAHDAVGVIGECLGALRAQRGAGHDEVIVVDSSTDGTDHVIRERFPDVRLLHFCEPLAVPQLRARGIAAARGEIVAILDPYSIVADDWVESVRKSHQDRANPIIGGTVELYDAARQDLLTWATYINEYGMFMPPMPEGEIEILAGSNISYKRSVLDDRAAPDPEGFWKTFVNDQARSGGESLWLDPDVRVSLKKPIPFGDFFRTRFQHGRCYAGMRARRGAPGERWLRAVTTPLLPLLFIARWGKRYWPKGRYREKFVFTLPFQLLLFGTWSLGELVGYLRGSGSSSRRLFY